MPDEPMHEGTSKFRLRKIAPDAAGRADNNGRSVDSQRSARDAASSISADARTIETIIRKAVDAVSTGSSNSPSQLQRENAELKERLSSTRSQLDASLVECDSLRAQLSALENKHIQFVEANIAFTQWRDQIEKERLSWAEANAKFAKRHEDNKAAKANLMAKYKAAIDDLDDMTAKYDAAAKEIARLTGNFPPAPTAPSSRHPLPPPISPPGSASLDRSRDREGSGPRRTDITREREQRPPKDRSVRGVEREPPPRLPPFTHPQLVEQSVLRERLTSDMFTLSQKVLEERAQRAEEGRALAERRIFELEGQIARTSVNGGPSDSERTGGESGVVHWRDTGGAHRGYPPNLPNSHHQPSYQHHARRDSNDSPSSSTWTHSPHNPLPSSSLPQPGPPPSSSTSPTQLQHRYPDKPDGPPRQDRTSPGDWGRGERERGPPSRPVDAAGSASSGEYDRDQRHYEHSASSSSPYANPRQSLHHPPPAQPPQQQQQQPPAQPTRYHSSSSSSTTTSPQTRTYPDWETRSDDRSSRSSSKRYSNGEPSSAGSDRRLPPLSRDYEPSPHSARHDARSLPPPITPSSASSTPINRPPSPPNRNGYQMAKVNGNNGSDRRGSGGRSYLNNTEDGDDDYMRD